MELVSTIDCFLGVRGQARATERRFAGDSQDEYGLMDPCDWGASPHEDGSGLQGSTEPSSVVDTFAQKDKAFAQVNRFGSEIVERHTYYIPHSGSKCSSHLHSIDSCQASISTITAIEYSPVSTSAILSQNWSLGVGRNV